TADRGGVRGLRGARTSPAHPEVSTMSKQQPRIVDLSETEPNRRRGGDLRTLLTPATVGSTSGFMGLAIIQPGERIAEHYHPYSEEFVFVVNGQLEVDLDGEPFALRADQ